MVTIINFRLDEMLILPKKEKLPLGRDNCLSNFLGERMMDWVKWFGEELFEEFGAEAEAEADASRRGI